MHAYVAGTLMFEHETAIQNARAQHIAAELQIWVAFASFAGATGNGYAHSAGSSGIWKSGGALIAQAGLETGAIVQAVFS